MRTQLRYIGAIASCMAAILWLTGCGGDGSATGALTNPNDPNNPHFPSTNRIRLYQHGDEFVYTVSGVARYREQRWQVSGTSMLRVSSAGAGVLRFHLEANLTLRRGSQTLSQAWSHVSYITQDRKTHECTLIGYADDLNDPMINSNLPYQVVIPGLWNEHSSFSYSVTFENGVVRSETYQIGMIEAVETYAGKYYSYRVRVEDRLDQPSPFVDSAAAATKWFSPQLGVWTRMEILWSTWRESEPIEYNLTYLLQRTNVSLQSGNT